MKQLKMADAAGLFTGKDKWCTRKAPGICSLRTSDGPNGLRIEKTSALGFSESHPAAAFPCACLSACSFDPKLQYELGAYLAQECGEADVRILLAPGVNHKRSPLCGRNFEYYSEDPYLTSELASAYVRGLQDHGVAACLKHFAANSREYGRTVSDSLIDERALHELYLSQFERVVKTGHPWSLMCAYNKLNGTYCCENRELMDLARGWGFDGVFISDWGGVADPENSFAAGLNLEMPGGERGSDRRILKAVEEGRIPEERLAEEADVFHRLSERTAHLIPLKEKKDEKRLACLIAEESAVLLRNEGELPLAKTESLAVIGPFARRPRIQGAGSSQVNPRNHDSLYEILKEERIPFSYAQGYHTHTSITDPILEDVALLLAKKASHVIVMLGLSDGEEAEGYDRETMKLAENQLHLVDAIARSCRHVTVVLQCGAPVELPFRENVQAVLCMYLAGASSGRALYRLLYGIVNPCGHLAETWPEYESDVPCAAYFSDDLRQVQYRESIFSGYRYYERAEKKPAYAFGHGLSYTAFSIDDLCVSEQNENTEVRVRLRNIGKREGAAVIQIYVGMQNSRIARPVKELKAFQKVFLLPDETEEITLILTEHSFSYYDVKEHDWKIEEGIYRISAGFSSDDIRKTEDIRKNGTACPYSAIPWPYFHLENGRCTVSQQNFEQALGRPVPDAGKVRPFTVNTTFHELRDSFRGKYTARIMKEVLKRKQVPGVRDSMVFESPIRHALWFVQSWDTIDAIVDFFNGKRSLFSLLARIRKEGKPPSEKKTERQGTQV